MEVMVALTCVPQIIDGLPSRCWFTALAMLMEILLHVLRYISSQPYLATGMAQFSRARLPAWLRPSSLRLSSLGIVIPKSQEETRVPTSSFTLRSYSDVNGTSSLVLIE